jgi:hypothetical protein
MRRDIGRLALGTLAAVVALVFTAGCPPNEAKVCSTKTENVGPGCSATYDLCKGTSDRVDCAPDNGGVTCTCFENGAKTRTFVSNDACNVTPDTLKKRVAAGCNFDILDDDSK